MQPTWVSIGKRTVRDYPEPEVRKIELIFRYRREGFEHYAAYARAVKDLEEPRLI